MDDSLIAVWAPSVGNVGLSVVIRPPTPVSTLPNHSLSTCRLTTLVALATLLACTQISLAEQVQSGSLHAGAGQAGGDLGEMQHAPKRARKKHYLRTTIQEALALAGGTAWYWIDRERQVADWDFPSLAERMSLDVIRYDNNPHHVNFAWHAGNGTAFHAIARSNGLSFLESIAAGALTSLTWEYALEYREKVSLNDLIFTTGAGVPLGEFMHVLGRYLSEDPEAASVSAARWTLGLPTSFARAIDGAEPASVSSKPTWWHRLHLGYQFSAAAVDVGSDNDEHSLHSLQGGGRFVRLPGYLEPGSWQRTFYGAEFTQARFHLGLGGKGSATAIDSETILLGWHRQSIERESRQLSQALTLGIATGYRYRREELGIWDDRVGVYHFPGLAADLHLAWRGLHFTGRARLHADFAGINALSNSEWEAAHPDLQAHGKAILRKQGYYYGYGASTSISANLRFRNVALGGRLWAARYHSDEGLDRTQENLQVDQKSNDRLLERELWLHVEGLPYHGYLGLMYTRRQRSAQLEEFGKKADLSRLTLQLGLAL